VRTVDCEQGTPEWFQARCGRVTGSRIADVMAKGKGGAPSVTRANYIAELAAERLSGQVCQDAKFQSAAMKQGSEREAEARALYAFMHNAKVATVGFVLHPEIEWAGCSPDTLVGDTGMAEHKCPLVRTHLDTLRGASIDGGYAKQMQFQMDCTGREWVDFVSYSPAFPSEMQLHVTRVHRDEPFIKLMRQEIFTFLTEVEATVEELSRKYLSKAA
jgi:putative phage-type endonuclease